MPLKKDQYLVNAQVDISRAVFEMNRPGYPKKSKARKTVDRAYIEKCVRSAIDDLKLYLK